LRGTSIGIIEASAGPKKVVTVETTTINTYSRSRLLPTTTIAIKASPRRMFVTTSIWRLSTRSTKTPARAEKMIAGSKKLSRSTLTALFEPEAA
jgi:hypothetical protein